MKMKKTNYRVLIAVVSALIVLGISHSSYAQSPDLIPVKTSQETTGLTEKTHPTIRLTPDKSELIHLDTDVSSIIVSNPAHISVLTESTKTLIIVPKMPGASYFSALDKEGNVNQVGFLKKNDNTYTATLEESLKMLTEAHFPASVILNEPIVADSTIGRPNRPTAIEWRLATEISRPNRIRWAINKFKPYKSPGVDGIYPILLQKGQEILIPHLCRIFKACIAIRYIPIVWQKVTVIYLPKVGKVGDKTPKSYRPISLMSFLLKTLDRQIHKRRGITKEPAQRTPICVSARQVN